ncbi:MAG: gamma-glutamyltransferase family protein [Gemmatimonadales bacterium]
MRSRPGVTNRHVIAIVLLSVFGSMSVWCGTLMAQGRYQTARSTAGMVVTAHPLATWAGVHVLEQGGNAADAAAAAAFAVAVVRPSMNSIGGRNQILIRNSDGRIYGIDGTTQVPTDYDSSKGVTASYGYATIGVPGALAGLIRLYKEHGSLPLETVMAPAIEYAENGFRLLPGQAWFHTLAAKQIAESKGARASYLKPDMTPYRAGDLLRQPVLAQTYRKIARGGADVFYRGEIAHAIAADMAEHGGLVTLQSLANYRAEDARIVHGSYRGYDLVAMDVPASGAIAVQSLQIMENFSRAEYTAEEWATITAQAIALAIPDLRRLGPDTTAKRATSKEWAASQAKKIRIGDSVGAHTGGSPSPRFFPPDDSGYTTHISVADSAGMIVSLTQTVGPIMGSKVATPGLGFLYAVTLGGYLSGATKPGTRARSGITPVFVLRDGKVVLVLGAAGGLRIISSVVQVASRVIDDGLSLPDALAAPRVHPSFDSTFAFDGIAMETLPSRGWTQDQVAVVKEMGFKVTSTPRAGSFGRVQAIRFHSETGVWEGASDPGSEGTARGPGGQQP